MIHCREEGVCLFACILIYIARLYSVCVHLPDDKNWTNQKRGSLPNISKTRQDPFMEILNEGWLSGSF